MTNSETPPIPETIPFSPENPFGRTDDWPYGFHSDGTPRKDPIRLLSAIESIIYWVVLFVSWVAVLFILPMYVNTPWDFRPFGMDGAQWLDIWLGLSIFGWLPFGLIGNVVIRVLNKFVLKTDTRRPSKVKTSMFGASASRVTRGYKPPTSEGL